MELVFIHGYSDNWSRIKNSLGNKFENFNNSLSDNSKIDNLKLHYISYKSLEDSATFEDLVEGLYEKLIKNNVVKNLLDESSNEKISFIVHSTGGLIVRQLLKQYSWLNIHKKIDKIIFLAPANFGSPLAHKGKTILGKVLKGNWSVDEDFLEVGKNILNGLELASFKQWEIADFDLFGGNNIYGLGKILPLVITGTKPYDGYRKYINEDGTDGTIVVAGVSLNARKYKIDFTQNKNENKWSKLNSNSDYPTLFLKEYDHSSIVDNLDDSIMNLIIQFLKISKQNEYSALLDLVDLTNKEHINNKNYQQLYFNLKDDRNFPINDYLIEFNILRKNDCEIDVKSKKVIKIRGEQITEHINNYLDDKELKLSDKLDKMLQSNAHTNSQNPHLRRFLIIPSEIKSLIGTEYLVTMNIEADTNENEIFYDDEKTQNTVILDTTDQENLSFFFDNTTTLIEIKIDRYSNLVKRHSPENGYKEV